VYVGSNDGHLYAIDARSGREKWRLETGAEILSSPVVADGVVYVGSQDGYLYGVDAATGQVQWQFSGGAGIGVLRRQGIDSITRPVCVLQAGRGAA
jgi:eukaryotic-like serine/threonine-protein kinase